MAGFDLPTSIDADFPDDPATPAAANARQLHQQHHDALHRLARRFDDSNGSDGRALMWSGGLWVPGYVHSAPREVVLSSATAYAPTDADPGRVVHLTSASATVVTLPNNSNRPYATGVVLRFRQMGAGQVRIVGATGVTVLAPAGASYTAAQYVTVEAHKTGTNTWVLGPVGALTSTVSNPGTPAPEPDPEPGGGVTRPTATVTINPTSNLAGALNALPAGAVAKLTDGTYGATSTVYDVTRSGTSGSPITVMGNASNPGAVMLKGAWNLRGSNWRWFDLAWDGPSGPNSGGEQSPTGEQGLVWAQGSGQVFDNVIVRDSKYNYGLFIDGSNVTLSRSWIYNNGDWSNPTYQQSGGIAYNLHQGVYIGSGSGHRIENCLFEHNLAFGLQLYPTSTSPVVVNNTFFNNGYGSGQGHLIVASNVSNARVFNNIFHTSPGYAVKIFEITGTGNVVTRNLSYNNPGGYQSGSNISYVDNLNTANPLFTTTGDPVNAALQAGSPALSAGLSSYGGANAPTIDRTGTARTGSPDLGAYERV